MNKKILITLISIAGVVAITSGSLAVFLPVTHSFDKSLIKRSENYNVALIENDEFTTLAKVDNEGNPTDDVFKIIGFTDTHLDTYRKYGTITLEMMIRNIVRERPDLVIFDGDTITSSFNGRRAKQLANIMTELGVYWTAVLGNHEGDNVWSVSRKKMLQIYKKSPFCLVDTKTKYTSDGDEVYGYGNQVINILNKDNKIRQSLYLLDSGAWMSKEDLIKYSSELGTKNGSDYDYIKPSQIKWYKDNVSKINTINGGGVKSIMFGHIPLPEFSDAYDSLVGEDNTPSYGVKNEQGDSIRFGLRREAVCSSNHNSGMFDAIIEQSSTQAYVAGHDHINNFIIDYKGVKLGYCESSGYSSYNVVTRGLEKDLIQGYSIFNIDKLGELEWLNIKNADIWPELQDDILKTYK